MRTDCLTITKYRVACEAPWSPSTHGCFGYTPWFDTAAEAQEWGRKAGWRIIGAASTTACPAHATAFMTPE